MKKIMTFIFVFSIGITAKAQQRDIQDLVGKWDAVDASSAQGTLQIVDSTHIYLTFNGQKKPIIRYKADFTKKPIWFDFVVPEGDSTIHLKSILRIISNNKLQWQIFTGDNRPEYFTKDRGDMLYLVRKR
jgi:hypothetical protein